MERCAVHVTERTVLYCIDCTDKAVCTTCINTEHSGHTFRKESEVKEHLLSGVRKRKEENAIIKIKLEQDLAKLKDGISRHNRVYNKNRQEADIRRKDLKKMIDKQYKQNEEKNRKCHEIKINDLQTSSDNIRRNIKRVSQYETELSKLMNTDKVSDLIRHIQLLSAPNTDGMVMTHIPSPCKFVPSRNDPTPEIFGHIEENPQEDHHESIESPELIITHPTDQDDGAYASMTPSRCSSLSVTSESASEIEAVCNNYRPTLPVPQSNGTGPENVSQIVVSKQYDQCWKKNQHKNAITLVNRYGKEVGTPISFSDKISGFCYCLDEKLLVCLPEKKTIRQVDRYSSVDFISTGPFVPICVCSGLFDEDIVAVVERPGPNHGGSSCEIVRYKKTGKEEKRVRKDQFGNDIFYGPNKISFNRTGSKMAVINNKANTHLVVLDKQLELLWRYFGDGRAYRGDKNIDSHLLHMDTNMCLSDAVFDNTNNLVISDSRSHTVKLLNQLSMQPLRVIGTFTESPLALAMVYHNQTLWVLLDGGTLSVVGI
ncbi:uncharacterized protein [Argopecten irradians]|uniref:uncharacterized protein n=1 Tax=Argopecten irradians TaxID=31199 RepID=UPI003716F1D0